ncbi:MAG: MlaE family ABC transporter permease, partial [Bacteroidota bacterium]
MDHRGMPRMRRYFFDVPEGHGLLTLLVRLHNVNRFIVRFFHEGFLPPYEFREVLRQCYEIGYRSLGLVSLTGFITGMVFTKQARPPLVEFGASSWLPSMICIAMIRALAPLITALITAGKVGSNIGAELGSMNVTEQIDAMNVSAANPFKFLVASRILACVIMVPLLSLYMGSIGLAGAWLTVFSNSRTSLPSFFHPVLLPLSFLSFSSSLPPFL